MAEEHPELIFVSAQPMEIEMVRGLLESNGIKAFAIDDRLVPRLTPFYTQELGAMKLFVRPKDFVEASEIIRAHLKEGGKPPFYGAFSSLGGSSLNANAEELSEAGSSTLSKTTSRNKRKGLAYWTSPDGFLTVFIGILIILFVMGYIRSLSTP